MALQGEGVVAIWNDITEEGRENFYEWHNREHIPERVGIEGFLRGRRYVAISGKPQYFTLYEVASPAVLSSDAYLARLNAPTPWTTESVKHFRNVARSLCQTDCSLGTGSGGYLATLRFDCDPAHDPALAESLQHAIFPALLQAPGIVATHFCRADLGASTTKNAEQKGRPDNAVPRWVILVETSTPGAATAALTGSLSLAEIPLQTPARGVYSLQFDLT